MAGPGGFGRRGSAAVHQVFHARGRVCLPGPRGEAHVCAHGVHGTGEFSGAILCSALFIFGAGL